VFRANPGVDGVDVNPPVPALGSLVSVELARVERGADADDVSSGPTRYLLSGQPRGRKLVELRPDDVRGVGVLCRHALRLAT
jgi:hypothetical protein